MQKLINVAYKDLVYNSAINARGDAETDIAELVATIRSEGLGQPLLVRPARRNKSKFEIVEGSRRWRAIGVLIDDGAWKKDERIPCLERDLDDAQALELSLSTSLTRLSLSPAEEAIAFTALKKPVAEIALSFGIPERRVEQRLAIGQLHPPILEALKAGEINLETAQAFTLTPDPKRQAKLWKEFRKNDHLGANWVRRMLTDKAIAGDGREARLVGEEAYLAAGGTIRRDLFGEDVWFEDGPLLNRLFDEKIASIKTDLEAEGWSFVRVAKNDQDEAIYWSTLTPKDAPPPEDTKRLKQIEREMKAIAKPYGEDGDWKDEDVAKYRALEIEGNAIEAKGFTDRQRKASGAVIIVDAYDGLEIRRGKVEPTKAKRGASSDPLPPAGEEGARAPAREGEGDEEPDFAGQLLADLSGVMGGALQMTLVEKPGQALRLLIATLIMQAKSFTTPLFRLNPQAYAAPSPAHEDYRGIITELMRDAEGKDFFATLDHLDQLDEDAHHKLLAILLANSLNWSMHPGADGKALVRRLDPDCSRWFKADEAFFNSLKKQQLVDALSDVDAVDARGRANRKKPELVARCVEVLSPLNWLPQPLRSPCYTGPGSEAFAVRLADDIAARSASSDEGSEAPGLDPGGEGQRQLEAAE